MFFSKSALLSILLVFISLPLAFALPARVEKPRAIQPRASTSSCANPCAAKSGYTVTATVVAATKTTTCTYITTGASLFPSSAVCYYVDSFTPNALSVTLSGSFCPSLTCSSYSLKRSFMGEGESEMLSKVQKRQWNSAKANEVAAQRRK